MSTADSSTGVGTVATELDYPRWFHRFAWVLAALVFPLIWVGGLVTTTDAGMAVPDWPGTYNHNMFTYPWTSWFFGPWDLFIEHGHRLLASSAGMVCIGLFILSFRSKSRWLVAATGAALALIILQGVLGGVRVLFADRFLAMVHGCVGPAFFALVVSLIAMSSKWWTAVGKKQWWTHRAGNVQLSSAESKHLGSIWERLWTARSVAVVTAVLAYCQLILGANLRHVTEMASPEQYRVLIWFHVLMALAVTVASAILASRMLGPVPGLSRARWLLLVFIGIQLTLGLGTWIVKFGWPSWFDGYTVAQHFRIQEKHYWQVHVVTAHVAVGSLILAVATWCAVRLWRAEYCAGELLSHSGQGQWQELSKRHLPLYHS